MLLLQHLGASLIAVVDFVLFQATAIGLTIAVYFAIPWLDSSISQNSVNWNWIKIFQIISPTITVIRRRNNRADQLLLRQTGSGS